MVRKISNERKTTFYIGTILMVIGGLLFVSTFVTFISNFGDFGTSGNFNSAHSNIISGIGRAFGGMALLIIGGIVRGIGARGLAGSGVILDPERARGELEPYSRMAGGMAKDFLDEADINLGNNQTAPTQPQQVIMIKCRQCQKLNEEDSKFCQECGAEI